MPYQRLQHYFLYLCSFGFFALFFMGCNQIEKWLEGDPQTIVATDGFSQITVPGNWGIQTILHDDASLQVGHQVKELYLIVLTEAKSDLPESTIKDHAQTTSSLFIFTS